MKRQQHTKHVLFLLVGVFPVLILAQPQIEFDKYSHNYGPVSSQILVPAYFSFINTGNEPLAIILIEKGDDVIVKYENKFYNPNEGGELLVFHDNNKLGKFNEKLRVYTNQSEDPILLKIKGRNVDILECKGEKEREKEYCTIYVVDKQNKQPIKNAKVTLSNYSGNYYHKSTNRNGKIILKIGKGNYNIKIEAANYLLKQANIYVSHSGQLFVYELDNKMNTRDEEVPQGESSTE